MSHVFEELANEFLQRTSHCHGHLVRPNDTHYSLALVAEALSWIRSALSKGKGLTLEGERFVAGAAAYLGYLAYLSFDKRGLDISLSAQVEPGAETNHLALFVSRQRGGETESYAQDFLRDVHEVVLRPPQTFPSMKGHEYVLTSLTIPSVEYLYMLGVHFMVSPFSAGNWPEGEAAAGTDEDFSVSRNLLIDDLHTDVNLPIDDAEFRRLSNWVVWPPYGWQQNDGQRYNMMTLVDQIGIQKLVSLDHGVDYLRALLCSQSFHLRNLAARTLMVLGQAPDDPQETRFYLNALSASDHELASSPMIRFRWVLEDNDPDATPNDQFVEETGSYWQEMLQTAPREPWATAPILHDPLYQRLDEPLESAEQRRELIRTLRERYPGDWHAEVAHGYEMLEGSDPAAGEATLTEAIESTPGDLTAHFTLAHWYYRQGELQKAEELYNAAVQLSPWDPYAVSNAMWLLTQGIVA